MLSPMSEEDRVLDALWRETFGEPMPILGGGAFVREVLGLPVGKPRPRRSNQTGARVEDSHSILAGLAPTAAPALSGQPIRREGAAVGSEGSFQRNDDDLII